MLTIDEIIELMKEREDVYSVIDLLDPTVEELVEALSEHVIKESPMLSEYYEDIC